MTTVAIIGAGPAGLVAAKSCLEEGLTPVVLEKSSKLGGVWQGGADGHAWGSMRTNLSRWNCMFSDFPWSENQLHDFPTQGEMGQYLNDYAEHFGLMDHILFNRIVQTARQSEKGWILTSGSDVVEADRLIVASGFFSKPSVPEFDAPNILNSAQFKSVEDFKGKKVTVIGGSFSGYEIAAELAREGVDVTHIMRRPAWIMARHIKGMPTDLVFGRRKDYREPVADRILANKLTAKFYEETFGNPGEVHQELGIDPSTGKPNYVVISKDYLDLVQDKKLNVMVSPIQSIKDQTIYLEDGRTDTSDVIITCTGFESSLDFFDEETRAKINYDAGDQFMPLPLYKTVLPQNLENVSFVGFYRGPYFRVMELQSRYAAAVIAGKLPMPDAAEIATGVEDAICIKAQRPRPQFPYRNNDLCLDFAQVLGIEPLLDDNDPLHSLVEQGANISAHDRLKGVHANRGMAEKIMASLPDPKI